MTLHIVAIVTYTLIVLSKSFFKKQITVLFMDILRKDHNFTSYSRTSRRGLQSNSGDAKLLFLQIFTVFFLYFHHSQSFHIHTVSMPDSFLEAANTSCNKADVKLRLPCPGSFEGALSSNWSSLLYVRVFSSIVEYAFMFCEHFQNILVLLLKPSR